MGKDKPVSYERYENLALRHRALRVRQDEGGVYHGHCRNCVVRHPCGRHDLHPTQKPLALMEELIELSSNPGDTVFDPFMGSGTTGIAALRKGRGFFGIELSDEYFKVANNRIMEFAFA